MVRLKDVAKVDLAALDYSSNSYLDRDPAVALAVFQRPGSNALATAKAIRSTMEALAPRFPPGVKYTIVYDPTQFIQESVNEVQKTILMAILLVVLVAALAAYYQHILGHDRIQYVVAFLGFFMIFAMWLFPEVKREETAGGVRSDTTAQ